MSNTTAKDFNQIMDTMIKNGITAKQYDIVIQKMAKAILTNKNIFLSNNALQFINNVRDVHDGETNTIELFYPIIANILLCYIENMKEFDSYHNRKTPLTELVVSFSELTGVGIELIGDICNYDTYFKKFLSYENRSTIEPVKPKRVYKEYNVEISTELFNW